MVVAAQWTGTEADRHDMQKFQLDQVLRRNFGRLAIFGFASTLLCSWEFIFAGMSLTLLNGGTAGLFWNYIVVCFGCAAVYSSLAELASIMPTAGGQYYWVSVLAPENCRNFLSFITGWLCATAWVTGVASSTFLAGTMIQGLIALNTPDYTFKNWHGTLLTIAIAVVAIIFNTLGARKLPLIEVLLVIFHLVGVVIVIPLWVYSPIRSDGRMFTEFYNGGGWSSTGLSSMVGLLSTALSLTGLDCAVHMAEETKDSSRNLPISIMTGFVVNAVLGLFVLFTVIFTIGPVESVLETATGYPFIELFFAVTKSYAATNTMTAVLIINFTACSVAILATASRQLWSFARNRGVPFSEYFAPKNLPHEVPMLALFFSLAVTIALSLINIGSTAALNAIFALTTSSILTSYMVTVGSTISWRLRGKALPVARFSLGRYGLWINIAAMIYLIPVFIFSFFPTSPNPTAKSMNWAIVMYGAIAIFAASYYVVYAKNTFRPPTEEVKRVVIAQEDVYAGSETAEKMLDLHHVKVMPEKTLEN